MELIDTINISHQGEIRKLMLFVGDLAHLPENEAVDLLVISAFPDDYCPTPTSLIGALNSVGVSVSELAQDKEVDLRKFSSCWLSKQFSKNGIYFKRILCFEPKYRGLAAEVVGDIFRSLVPFCMGNLLISQIAMPLVASGDQGEPEDVMLDALTEACFHWLSEGRLPLDKIKIILHENSDIQLLKNTFQQVKKRHEKVTESINPNFKYDIFVSYSHKNKTEVDNFVAQLHKYKPHLRIFIDRLELRSGASWQKHIFEAIDSSEKIICIYSPDYILSKVCMEEFNIAVYRHRESEHGVLFPLYLYTTDGMPTYMKLIQCEDAREGNNQQIPVVAKNFIEQFYD